MSPPMPPPPAAPVASYLVSVAQVTLFGSPVSGTSFVLENITTGGSVAAIISNEANSNIIIDLADASGDVWEVGDEIKITATKSSFANSATHTIALGDNGIYDISIITLGGTATMTTEVVGSQIPAGNKVGWYYGGAEACIITEDLVETAGVITLTKKAEYGSIICRTAAGAMTDSMLELTTTGPDVAATDTTGTAFVKTSAAGVATITVMYLDIETTALAQIIACKDVSSPLSIDTSEESIHNQTTKLQLTGAASRTFTAEQVDYNILFMGSAFGDLIIDSPAAGMYKFTDKYTSVKKLSAVVGKRVVNGVLKKKWCYFGLQVTKIDNSHPTTAFYARSMDFVVDSVVETDVVPN